MKREVLTSKRNDKVDEKIETCSASFGLSQLQLESMSTTEAIESLSLKYSRIRRWHAISSLSVLVQQNLKAIARALQNSDFSGAAALALLLFNETNATNIDNLADLLLADFTSSNVSYLQSLKILMIQGIIRQRNISGYKLTIITIFRDDVRWLDFSNTKKIIALIKLLLNLYAMLPEYRVLFGFKFLQYLTQFRLPFSLFLKELSLEQYKSQLISDAKNLHPRAYPFVNAFYLAYSMYDTRIDKILITDLELNKVRPLELSSLNSIEFDGAYYLSIDQHPQAILLGLEMLSNTNLTNRKYIISNLSKIWKLLIGEHVRKTAKLTNLMDSTLNFLNMDINDTAVESLKPVITILSDVTYYAKILKEEKRLINAINVLFNYSVIFKSSLFLSKATKLELTIYLNTENELQASSSLLRFGKFISSTSDGHLRNDIFQAIFCFANLISLNDIGEIFDYCGRIFKYCAKKLQIKHYERFNKASEVMEAILYGEYLQINLKDHDWLPLTEMLYLTLSGKYIQRVTQELKSTVSHYHFLYRYEVLIKLMYLLHTDMAKHITDNLTQIVTTYLKKWVHKKNLEEISINKLEIRFLKSLLLYLKINNFDRIILQLFDEIKTSAKYDTIVTETTKYALEAALGLGYTHLIDELCNDIQALKERSWMTELDASIPLLESQMIIYVWKNNLESFKTFYSTINSDRDNKLFDISNRSKMSAAVYIQIIIFNIELRNLFCKIALRHNNFLDVYVECKHSLKLCLSLIKSNNITSHLTRLRLIQYTCTAYQIMIELMFKIGIFRDSEYYISELNIFLNNVKEPAMIFDSLHFLYHYYHTTSQELEMKGLLKKEQSVIAFIDTESDFKSLTEYLYDQGKFEELHESLEAFFKERLNETYLPAYWKSKMGIPMEESPMTSGFSQLNAMNMLKEKFAKLVKNKHTYPFHRNLFESIAVVPSYIPQEENISGNTNFLTPSKNTLLTPRSSNMTPRTKLLMQRMEKFFEMDNLESLIQHLESLNVETLSYQDQLQISRIFFILSAVIGNMQIKSEKRCKYFERYVLLSNLSFSRPFNYEKAMHICNLESRSGLATSVSSDTTQLPSMVVSTLLSSLRVAAKSYSFVVIQLDFCPVTESLLVMRYEPLSNRHIQINLPICRDTLRDLDSSSLPFENALSELHQILKECNTSTSSEVTNAVRTKEDRKLWWEKRHLLDEKLSNLLETIEDRWINGLRGILQTKVINLDDFLEFKHNLYQILHQILPTRKQTGSFSSFSQLEDWIIELFLYLDPDEPYFISAMEDLLYMILDILMYSGEENAYDEIDFSLLHIQLEEEIRKYNLKNSAKHEQVTHIFLILGGSCQYFPWESLNCMNHESISRIPSMEYLHNTLSKFKNQLPIKVPISEKLAVILNPNGDLPRTEERFFEPFKNRVAALPNSQIIANRKPSESEFIEMISNSNLFIYLGHGGGEQYVRTREIKKLSEISTSLLIGCSSAVVRSKDNLSPTSTMYSYLMGGCPFVLGNLWDVTDKDIDKFSKRLFELSNVFGTSLTKSDTITCSITNAREACNLRFLNGASPVAYGLPIQMIN